MINLFNSALDFTELNIPATGRLYHKLQTTKRNSQQLLKTRTTIVAYNSLRQEERIKASGVFK